MSDQNPKFNGVRVIEDTVSALSHLIPVYMPSVQSQFNAFQNAVNLTKPQAPTTPKS